MPCSRVAVTGVGMISALGSTAEATFERLLSGESAVAPVVAFDGAGYRSSLAAEVLRGAEPQEPASQRGRGLPWDVYSRSDRLALVAAHAAWSQAGHSAEVGGLGISVGASAGAMLEAEALFLAERGEAGRRAAAGRLVQHPLSATAQILAQVFGPAEPIQTLCSACSSGAAALALAAAWIQNGTATRCLAGGVDALCRLTFAGFNALGATDPERARPFDARRQGLVLGEGAAFLVLESEAVARARGARILAWFSGWALGAEAHHLTQPEPTGERAAQLILEALSRAGLSPRQVGYLNAHGTGTLHNDAMESLAIHRAFGDHTPNVLVSSCKGQLGHTLAAAGAIEAAVTVMAVERGRVPPTGGLEEPAPECALSHVLGSGRSVVLRAALSTSFGFGGAGAVLAFEPVAEASPWCEQLTTPTVVVTGASFLGRYGLRTGADLADLLEGAMEPPDRAPLAGDALQSLDPDRSRRFDATAALVTLAAERAQRDAALEPAWTGLVVGSSFGPVERSVDFLARAAERGPRWASPAEFPHLVASAGSGLASVYSGFSGPVLTVSERTGCSEAACRVGLQLIQAGAGTAVVAGGGVAADALTVQSLVAQGVRGEGEGEPAAAFLVLESEAHARLRGVRPLAQWIRALTLTPDARGILMDQSLITTRLLLIGVGDWGALGALIEGTPWAPARRAQLRGGLGSADSLGALALGAGAALVASGVAERVGVATEVGGGRWFWGELAPERPGSGPESPGSGPESH